MEWKPETTTLRLIDGNEFSFAAPGAGRVNSLLVDTIELFGPRYAPGALIYHLYDPANTINIHESACLAEVGIPPLPIELLPEIILYQQEKQQLFLISIASMSGIVSTPRKHVLEQAITSLPIRSIYVSAFYGRDDYRQAVHEIAWRSYAWLAYDPDHVIVHW